jgi:hypothetical protein
MLLRMRADTGEVLNPLILRSRVSGVSKDEGSCELRLSSRRTFL